MLTVNLPTKDWYYVYSGCGALAVYRQQHRTVELGNVDVPTELLYMALRKCPRWGELWDSNNLSTELSEIQLQNPFSTIYWCRGPVVAATYSNHNVSCLEQVSPSFSLISILTSFLLEIYLSKVLCPGHPSPLLPFHESLDIIVECSPDNAGNPALNGLALVILDIERGQFDLENISETNWKHGGTVEMYVVNPPVIRLRTC